MQAVVITGLAQGIGREVAKLLARSKVPVAGFDVDKDGIESLKKEFEKAGCDHLLMTLDIADRPGILKFRDMVLEKFGRVDVVLSNVGIGFFGPFEEVDLEKAAKMPGDQRYRDCRDLPGVPAFDAGEPQREADRRIVLGRADSIPVRIDLLGQQVCC